MDWPTLQAVLEHFRSDEAWGPGRRWIPEAKLTFTPPLESDAFAREPDGQGGYQRVPVDRLIQW